MNETKLSSASVNVPKQPESYVENREARRDDLISELFNYALSIRASSYLLAGESIVCSSCEGVEEKHYEHSVIGRLDASNDRLETVLSILK